VAAQGAGRYSSRLIPAPRRPRARLPKEAHAHPTLCHPTRPSARSARLHRRQPQPLARRRQLLCPARRCRLPTPGRGRTLVAGRWRPLLRDSWRFVADRLPPWPCAAGRSRPDHGRRPYRLARTARQAAPGRGRRRHAPGRRRGLWRANPGHLCRPRPRSRRPGLCPRCRRRTAQSAGAFCRAAAASAQPGDPHEPRGERKRPQVQQAERVAAAARRRRRHPSRRRLPRLACRAGRRRRRGFAELGTGRLRHAKRRVLGCRP